MFTFTKTFAVTAKLIIIATLLLIPTPSSASTAITTYGTITNIQYVYGVGGLVNHILITMDNLDTSGTFVYVCRRPNLTPCTSAIVGVEYQFRANMTGLCTVPNKVCGEGTISSLIPLTSLR